MFFSSLLTFQLLVAPVMAALAVAITNSIRLISTTMWNSRISTNTIRARARWERSWGWGWNNILEIQITLWATINLGINLISSVSFFSSLKIEPFLSEFCWWESESFNKPDMVIKKRLKLLTWRRRRRVNWEQFMKMSWRLFFAADCEFV